MAYYTPDGIAIGIIHEGQRRGISQKGIQIALSTGLVESDLYMHANEGDPQTKDFPHDKMSADYDSSGVFQQRPVWWGTPNERMDVAYSAGMFYAALGAYNYNSDEHTPGWYAYQVQQCAEEYAYRYDERYPEACDIYARLAWEVCPEQPGTCNVAGAIGPLVTASGESHPSVGEVVLAYDHSIVPQETGYWCGPASTQVVLNEAGIHVSEQQLANEMGTDANGTDYIGQIELVLDRYVGDIYATVDTPHDPMTNEQKERLWADILRSIDGGWGIVMNWVAPSSNYPRGIKGSESPHYGGGTVYHYVACMGYDDNPNERACWIADSGFSPFGYWCSFDQVATLIPPKGYTYAAVAPPAPPAPDYVRLGYEQLCGPIDPASGYGTGWAQLGQNAAGQNLYFVDALAAVKHLVEGRPVTSSKKVEARSATPDYLRLEYEQMAGPVGADGYGHGWAQLDGLSITDALGSIKRVLEGGEAPPVIPPPPTGGGTPTDRHALLTCSGTWAPPGVGYPSDVANGCLDVIEEIPVVAPWSMGPLGGASGEGAQSPSYQESIQTGVDWAVDWLLAHPNRTFLLGGYSQGGECAARIHQETLPGGRLESVRANYIGGFTFGNPSRQQGHTYYQGPPRPDEGIAEYRQSQMWDDWADECDDGDMYSGVPLNLAGEIMRDVYTMVTEMQLHDGFAEFARDFAYNCVEILGNLDGDAGENANAQAQRFGVNFEGAQRIDVDEFMSRFGQGDRFVSVKGIAAAIQAAVIAITFFAQGTAPHIEYHIREVFPGQTYLAHAIQHVRYWANTRVPTQ